MEVVTGPLSSIIAKLGDLVVSEYNLQKGVKGEIGFLKTELERMQGALLKVSNTPIDQLDIQDRIWARHLRELSYDIEDSIDTFLVRCKSTKGVNQHGFKKVIDRCLDWLMQPKIRHKIATDIKYLKSRVEDVAAGRHRYQMNNYVDKPVILDPRLLFQFEKATELIGIDEAREEVIRILIESSEVSDHQENIVSIVGFGGLGKTTLAKVVYAKLRTQFDCSAFVSVSRTPDLEKIFKDMLNQLTKDKDASINVINFTNELREFLENKRYFIVIDDIWDIEGWKMLKCALPDNNIGYKIITTTRNHEVAKEVGGVFKLNPLSLDNARKLLYKRIFGNDSKCDDEDTEKCPDEELAEASDRILKKCAGVPLAIITMASLLACKSRNKMDWYEVYHSIGTGLDNSLDTKNMRKILSFSYYDMPYHLRTCLLHLSMFPEDYEIDKDRLIRMWIAEGFIRCEKQAKKSLFEVGESYFNELINRSMIQPIHYNFGGIYRCRVHDMVLDLICSLSSEENFVTILNGTDHLSASNSIRRLSLQNCKEDHDMAWASRKQVRSVVIFSSVVDLIPALGSFPVLRVLDLQGCDLSRGYNLKYLGNLFHLRYLGLCATRIAHLPQEIGNMQWLQTLDVRNNNISSLPSTVVQLRNLMCLCIDESTRVPNGIGGLTCLEELSELCINDSNMGNIEELGRLRDLRVLKIVLTECSDKLVECLPKLQKIQKLSIWMDGGQRSIGGLDGWVAPPHLRWLDTRDSCWFSTLPAWLKPSLLPDLSRLRIAVRELQQDGLEILGRLPALRSLDLEVGHEGLGILERFVVRARSFPCLGNCWLHEFARPVVFEEGAMPRLRELFLFKFSAHVAREIGSSLELGLGNLQSLQQVHVSFRSKDEEVMDKATAALRREAEIHPNRPSLNFW